MDYYGEKVRLRPPERRDAAIFVRWLRNPAMRRYLGMRYISEAQEEKWIEHLIAASSGPTPSELPFVIEERLTERPIGNLTLRAIHWRDRHAELGIVIGEEEFWGKGYGTDAILTLLEIGFLWYGLHRIYLIVLEENERAIRAYEKCGFRVEGRQREAVFMDGRYVDHIQMSILAHEFTPRGLEG